MEQTNTSYERNNTQNNSTRTGNTEQRNFGGRFNIDPQFNNSRITSDLSSIFSERFGGNTETRNSIHNTSSNASELFQNIINTGSHDNLRNIIHTVAAHTIMPALTNFINQNTPPEQIIGLTEEEISDVTTELCFREIIDPTNLECPISQETFEADDDVIMLQCGHIYKKESILQWFTQGTYCPLCRVPLTQRENRNISEPMTFHIGISVDDAD